MSQNLNEILKIEERELTKLRKEAIAARRDPDKMLVCYKKSLLIINELKNAVIKSEMNSEEKSQYYGKVISNFITEMLAVLEYQVIKKKVMSGKLKDPKKIQDALQSASSYQIAHDPNFNKFTKESILGILDEDSKKIQACIDAMQQITKSDIDMDVRWDTRVMMINKIMNIMNQKVSPLVTKAGMDGYFTYSASTRSIYHTGISAVNSKISKKFVEDPECEVDKIRDQFSKVVKNIENKFKIQLRDAGIVELYTKPNTDLTIQLVVVDNALPVTESFVNYCYNNLQ
jgi:hypothetical protein